MSQKRNYKKVVPGSLPVDASSHAHGKASGKKSDGKYCYEFARTGKCHYGDKCIYPHIQKQPPSAPAPNNDNRPPPFNPDSEDSVSESQLSSLPSPPSSQPSFENNVVSYFGTEEEIKTFEMYSDGFKVSRTTKFNCCPPINALRELAGVSFNHDPNDILIRTKDFVNGQFVLAFDPNLNYKGQLLGSLSYDINDDVAHVFVTNDPSRCCDLICINSPILVASHSIKVEYCKQSFLVVKISSSMESDPRAHNLPLISTNKSLLVCDKKDNNVCLDEYGHNNGSLHLTHTKVFDFWHLKTVSYPQEIYDYIYKKVAGSSAKTYTRELHAHLFLDASSHYRSLPTQELNSYDEPLFCVLVRDLKTKELTNPITVMLNQFLAWWSIDYSILFYSLIFALCLVILLSLTNSFFGYIFRSVPFLASVYDPFNEDSIMKEYLRCSLIVPVQELILVNGETIFTCRMNLLLPPSLLFGIFLEELYCFLAQKLAPRPVYYMFLGILAFLHVFSGKLAGGILLMTIHVLADLCSKSFWMEYFIYSLHITWYLMIHIGLVFHAIPNLQRELPTWFNGVAVPNISKSSASYVVDLLTMSTIGYELCTLGFCIGFPKRNLLNNLYKYQSHQPCRNSAVPQVGIVSKTRQVYFDNNCQCNLVRSANTRILRDPPHRYDSQCFKWSLWYLTTVYLPHFVPFRTKLEPVSEEEFLEGRPQSSKSRYLRGKKAQKDAGPLPKYSTSEHFVKRNISIDLPGQKKEYKPRGILSCAACVLFVFGPLMMALAHRVHGLFKQIVKDLNYEQLCNVYTSLRTSFGFEPQLLDVAKYDNSQRKPAMIIQNKVDVALGVEPKSAKWMLKYDCKWKAKSYGHVDKKRVLLQKFSSSDGIRKSGDPHTSINNNLFTHFVCHAAMTLVYMQKQKIPLFTQFCDDKIKGCELFQGMINGDDICAFSHFPDLKIFNYFGLSVTTDDTFCSGKFIFDGTRYRYVRFPKDILLRIGWGCNSPLKMSEEKKKQLFSTLCYSLLATLYDVPIISCFLMKYQKNAGVDVSSNLPYTIQQMIFNNSTVVLSAKPSDAFRANFCAAFNIPVSTQLWLEHQLSTFSGNYYPTEVDCWLNA